MPQMIALALLGAGLYAGYKVLSRTAGRVAEDLKRAEEALRRRQAEMQGREAGEPRDLGRLVWDADKGVYRPAQEK